jgi:hypothetical protein
MYLSKLIHTTQALLLKLRGAFHLGKTPKWSIVGNASKTETAVVYCLKHEQSPRTTEETSDKLIIPCLCQGFE